MEFPFQWGQKHLYFVKSCLRKTLLKISTPPKKHNIFAFSHIGILCFKDCNECKESPKNLERHILSNGPHLVSPQVAQKVTKIQNEPTVEPYFWSLIDCHPVEGCIWKHWIVTIRCRGVGILHRLVSWWLRFPGLRVRPRVSGEDHRQWLPGPVQRPAQQEQQEHPLHRKQLHLRQWPPRHGQEPRCCCRW